LPNPIRFLVIVLPNTCPASKEIASTTSSSSSSRLQMAAMSVPQALQLLQLEPGATRKQIRAAYKRLALQLHPDKQHPQKQQQQQQSTAAFARLAAAYSLLLQGHLQQQQHQQDQEELQPFETAYATGSLFSEQLVDEAARCRADPADIWNL
jgi:DnaJ-class molecular chaperone